MIVPATPPSKTLAQLAAANGNLGGASLSGGNNAAFTGTVTGGAFSGPLNGLASSATTAATASALAAGATGASLSLSSRLVVNGAADDGSTSIAAQGKMKLVNTNGDQVFSVGLAGDTVAGGSVQATNGYYTNSVIGLNQSSVITWRTGGSLGTPVLGLARGTDGSLQVTNGGSGLGNLDAASISATSATLSGLLTLASINTGTTPGTAVGQIAYSTSANALKTWSGSSWI